MNRTRNSNGGKTVRTQSITTQPHPHVLLPPIQSTAAGSDSSGRSTRRAFSMSTSATERSTRPSRCSSEMQILDRPCIICLLSYPYSSYPTINHTTIFLCPGSYWNSLIADSPKVWKKMGRLMRGHSIYASEIKWEGDVSGLDLNK